MGRLSACGELELITPGSYARGTAAEFRWIGVSVLAEGRKAV
jgi:hypothetical protein